MKRLHRIALSLCLSLLLCVTCSSLFSVKASAASFQSDFVVEVYNYNEGSHLSYGGSTIQIDSSTSTTPTLTFDMFVPYGLLRQGSRSGFWLINGVLHSSTNEPVSFTVHAYDIYNNEVGYINRTTSGSGGSSGVQFFFGTDGDFVGKENSVYLSRLKFNITWPTSSNARTESILLGLYLSDLGNNETIEDVITAINKQTDDIENKIDEVLTPEGENNLGEAVDQITDQVQENLGALGFAHDTVENFIGLFNEEPPAPVINVPPLKMKIKGVEHQFFNGYQYDFRSMEDNGLSVLVGAVRTSGTLVLWWAFLQYCLKEFDGFFRR